MRFSSLLFLLVSIVLGAPNYDIYTTNCNVEAQSALIRALHHINSIPCSGVRFFYIREIPRTTIYNEFTNVVYCNATLTPPVLGQITMNVFPPYVFKMYIDTSVRAIALLNALMHEMGHAVGLEHVNNSFSVLYSSLNSSVFQVFTESENIQIAQKYWNCPQISNGRVG